MASSRPGGVGSAHGLGRRMDGATGGRGLGARGGLPRVGLGGLSLLAGSLPCGLMRGPGAPRDAPRRRAPRRALAGLPGVRGRWPVPRSSRGPGGGPGWPRLAPRGGWRLGRKAGRGLGRSARGPGCLPGDRGSWWSPIAGGAVRGPGSMGGAPRSPGSPGRVGRLNWAGPGSACQPCAAFSIRQASRGSIPCRARSFGLGGMLGVREIPGGGRPGSGGSLSTARNRATVEGSGCSGRA